MVDQGKFATWRKFWDRASNGRRRNLPDTCPAPTAIRYGGKMGNRTDDPEPEAWTVRDAALWKTAELAAAVFKNKLNAQPTVPVPFALRFGGADEGIYAHGAFRLLEFRANGDGSYTHKSSFVAATGRGAIPLMVGFAATQAIGNASRRSRAAGLAQQRWQPIDQGTVAVSNYGFYMHTPMTVNPWQWGSISLAELTGPGQLRIQGQSDRGPINWILESDWAELIFVFWASVCNPTSPQFVTRTWLPQDWLTKAFIWSKSNPAVPDSGFKALYDGLHN